MCDKLNHVLNDQNRFANRVKKYSSVIRMRFKENRQAASSFRPATLPYLSIVVGGGACHGFGNVEMRFLWFFIPPPEESSDPSTSRAIAQMPSARATSFLEDYANVTLGLWTESPK